MGWRGAAWVSVMVAACAVLLGFACGAQAAFTNVERRIATSATTSAAKSVTVTCPAGKRVMSAGADATPGDGDVLLDDVRPNATLTSVTARAVEDETGTAEAWYVAAYAICAPAPAGLERVVAVSDATSDGKAVTATCPPGKRVLGTGAESNGADGQLHLDGVRPAFDLTGVTVNATEDQTATAKSWSVTAYAICAAPVSGLKRVTTVSPSDSSASRVQTASCPAGKVLVGTGGEVNSAYRQLVLDALFPDEPLTSAGFAVWEDDTGNPYDWSATSYAMCAAQALRPVLDVAQTGPGTPGVALTCPAGMDVATAAGELDGGLGRAGLAALDPRYTPVDGKQRVLVQAHSTAPDVVRLAGYAVCTTRMPGREVVSAPGGDLGWRDSATATCPAGKRLIGAGASSPTNTDDVEAIAQAIVPSADLTSVTVTMLERRYFWLSFEAVAICAPPPAGLQLVTRSVAPDGEEYQSVVASCPAGKHVLGAAGGTEPAHGQTVLDEIRLDAALSSVRATSLRRPDVAAEPSAVSAYAICVSR